MEQYDVLVIGSGLSGLCNALDLSKDLKICIICKSKIKDNSSYYAQGGIAVPISKKDSVDLHIRDTLAVGGGICDEKSVLFTINNAKKSIRWLTNRGISFTRDLSSHSFHLNMEGGHSTRRVLHVGDYTGQAIQENLVDLARKNENIDILENHFVLDLIIHKGICEGAYIYDETKEELNQIFTKSVVLATGGFSSLYKFSTFPNSNGDGIAIAYRAGCKLANLEFTQFHPTCFQTKDKNRRILLLTEALRGEGASLQLNDGFRFMQKFHKDGDLAPRDVISRESFLQMQEKKLENVFLDLRNISKNKLEKFFPYIYKQLAINNIDSSLERIPVIPAAHYSCGGIIVNSFGLTNIKRLYAVGESSYTGLHGANRMASNSLLECLVFALSCSENIKKNINKKIRFYGKRSKDQFQFFKNKKTSTINIIQTIRDCMWEYVGLIRTKKGLESARFSIEKLEESVLKHFSMESIDVVKALNAITISKLAIYSAQKRKESRGSHYMLNYLKNSDLFLSATVVDELSLSMVNIKKYVRNLSINN